MTGNSVPPYDPMPPSYRREISALQSEIQSLWRMVNMKSTVSAVTLDARSPVATASPGSTTGTTTGTVPDADAAPPPTPSAPTVTANLAGIHVVWDGKGSAGQTMPPDFSHVEVHVSKTLGFTPSATTLAGTLIGSGYYDFVTREYGITHYVKLIAVDRLLPTPAKSGASAERSAIPASILRGDITNQEIYAKLIETQEFRANAIIGGTIETIVSMSGAVWVPNATDNNRVGLTSNGFEQWVTSGTSSVRQVFFPSDGTAATFRGTIEASTITGGTIQTASSGQRVVVSPNSGQDIRFFSGGGGNPSPGFLQFQNTTNISGASYEGLLLATGQVRLNNSSTGTLQNRATLDLRSATSTGTRAEFFFNNQEVWHSANHVHGDVPGPGTLEPDAITFGQTGNVGTATAYARNDHIHAMAGLGTSSTTAAAGNHGHGMGSIDTRAGAAIKNGSQTFSGWLKLDMATETNGLDMAYDAAADHFTIPIAGWYVISGLVGWSATNTTSGRFIAVLGSSGGTGPPTVTYARNESTVNAASWTITTADVRHFSANDTVSVWGFSNVSATVASARLSVVYVGT